MHRGHASVADPAEAGRRRNGDTDSGIRQSDARGARHPRPAPPQARVRRRETTS